MALTEKQRAYQRSWAAKNRERVRESKRRYRERQRLGLRVKGREYWRDPMVQERAKARRRTPEGKARRHEEWLKYRASPKYLYKILQARCKKYGLTIEQYQALLIKQNNTCACCSVTGDLDIDHDHITGKVRGLLCRLCNSFIGYLEKHNGKLDAVRRYLEVTSCPP